MFILKFTYYIHFISISTFLKIDFSFGVSKFDICEYGEYIVYNDENKCIIFLDLKSIIPLNSRHRNHQEKLFYFPVAVANKGFSLLVCQHCLRGGTWAVMKVIPFSSENQIYMTFRNIKISDTDTKIQFFIQHGKWEHG